MGDQQADAQPADLVVLSAEVASRCCVRCAKVLRDILMMGACDAFDVRMSVALGGTSTTTAGASGATRETEAT